TIPNQVTWSDPMEINLIRPKEPDDLATIKCQIKSLLIPSAIVDTGVSISVITKDLAERLRIGKNHVIFILISWRNFIADHMISRRFDWLSEKVYRAKPCNNSLEVVFQHINII